MRRTSTFSTAAVLSTLVGTASMAAPPNDACLSALGDPIPGSGGTVIGTVIDATPDGSGCGFPVQPGRDVYHSFVPATRGPWKFDLCASSVEWDTVLSIHRHPSNSSALACPTSGANRVAGGCDDDSCTVFGAQVPSLIRSISLEPGVLYTIRVAGFDGASTVDAYALAVTDLSIINDRCADASQSPIAGSGGVLTGALGNATTDGSVNASTCLGSTRAGSVRDVYHEFTPATSGRWAISTCVAGTAADTVVSIHAGCPATGANAIACNNNGCEDVPGASIVSANLTAGVTYVIRVADFLPDRFLPTFGDPTYTLSVSNESLGRCCDGALALCSVVASDQCPSGSTFTLGGVCSPLFVGGADVCSVGTFDSCDFAAELQLDQELIASTVGLTGSSPASCSTLTADCWFTFTAPMDGTYQLVMNPRGFIALVTSVYASTACPPAPASQIECGFAFNDGLRFPMTAGQSVKIRAAASGATVFSTIVTLATVDVPNNDLCVNAQPISRNSTIPGTLIDAAGGLSIGECSTGLRDVWYTYTAPVTETIRVVATPSAGTQVTLGVSVSTTCDGAISPLACAAEPFGPETPTEAILGVVAGQVYLIRVGTSVDGEPFQLGLFPAPPGPANDLCSSATVIQSGQTLNGTTVLAQGSTGQIGISCSDDGLGDVWYRFTPPATGTYRISVTAGATEPSVGLGVFAACPFNGAESITCVGSFVPGIPNELQFLGTAGVHAFIRVASGGSTPSTFAIVVEPSATPIGACCSSEGGCFLVGSSDCTLFAGQYVGDNVACAPTLCPPAGRCCLAGSSGCIVTTQLICTGPGATFTSGGLCDPVGCPQGAAPANDVCANAPLLTLPAAVIGATDLSDAEGPAIPAGYCGPAQALELGLDRSIYYRFVAVGSGVINFDVDFIDFPQPMLVVYEGANCNALTDIACFVGFQRGERRTFSVEAGRTYHIGIGIHAEPDLTNNGGVLKFRLSTACIADFNGSGSIGVDDIFEYLNAWFAGDPRADVNGVAGLTVQDIFDFLNAWFTGC